MIYLFKNKQCPQDHVFPIRELFGHHLSTEWGILNDNKHELVNDEKFEIALNQESYILCQAMVNLGTGFPKRMKEKYKVYKGSKH